MRRAYVETLADLAERDSRILFLTGDLGFMAIEAFSERFPDRFFNVGVAEQNMIGLATGLAEAGYFPFVYSIATFASLRPYEFIRNGPILHQLPVRIAAIGGGFEYGSAGPTHHGIDDIGVMRVQPGITIVAPADHAQARTAVSETWNLPGPVYYRLGKDDRTLVPGLDGRFELGRAQFVRDGTDVLIVSMGSITPEAVAASELLEQQGISCGVMVVASLSPAPLDDLEAALREVPLVITVEAHYVTGGVGSLVAEVIAERSISCRLVRHAVSETSDGVSGSEVYLHRRHNLDSMSIAVTAERLLARATV